MKLKIQIKHIAAAALGLSMVGCATYAEIDAKSGDPLRKMSDRLSSTSQFSFTASRKLDKQLLDDSSNSGNATITAKVARPDRVAATVRGGGEERQLYLNKNGSALYTKGPNLYALFAGQPTIDKACDAAEENLGVHIPMQDFLAANPYKGFMTGSDKISHVGVETLGGVACDHLMGTRDDLEWNLWIGQADSLPRKYTITAKALKGKDHLQLVFSNWKLADTFPEGTFTFNPPKGSQEIEFLTPAN